MFCTRFWCARAAPLLLALGRLLSTLGWMGGGALFRRGVLGNHRCSRFKAFMIRTRQTPPPLTCCSFVALFQSRCGCASADNIAASLRSLGTSHEYVNVIFLALALTLAPVPPS